MKTLYFVLIPVFMVILTVIAWLWNGPAAFVPGIPGSWVFVASPAGLTSSTNSFAEAGVPMLTAVLRSVCAGVAALAALGLVLHRWLGEWRLPSPLVCGIYGVTLAIVCASPVALRSRPPPERYAASLPVHVAIPVTRPASAPPSETVAPGLTLHFDCLDSRCGVRAGDGCAAYPDYPPPEHWKLRRDERRGWWAFDTGEAQLLFRDGDHACLAPRYVHVMRDVRPATGAYVLAFALVLLATLSALTMRSASANARRARFFGFLALLSCAWALYPALPALLTVWF